MDLIYKIQLSANEPIQNTKIRFRHSTGAKLGDHNTLGCNITATSFCIDKAVLISDTSIADMEAVQESWTVEQVAKLEIFDMPWTGSIAVKTAI